MKLLKLTPVLRTKELAASTSFYVAVLGFKCLAQSEEWVALERDDVEIMLALPNAHVPFERPQFTGSIYFQTDEVDAWWERLKSKGKVVYPIENFSYGMREFAVEDINGYCLQFGQEIEDSSQIPAEQTN
jgi:uncharacterized glyoxalase superfamily protein PhnB